MPYANPNALVDTDWLARNLHAPDVALVDATWLMPGGPKTPYEAYLDAHLPGAVHFDIDAIADRSVDLPHMLPDPETFAAAVGALGIGNDDRVIVCDPTGGPVAAARVWWTFRVFGHDNVALLSGGLAKWAAEGRPVESGPVSKPKKSFHVNEFRPPLVRSIEQLMAGTSDQLIDARAADRFAGIAPEPRPSKKVGHMPGAINLPFAELFDGTEFKPADALAERIAAAGIDPARPVVSSCGSGVTAAPLAFALFLLGYEKRRHL